MVFSDHLNHSCISGSARFESHLLLCAIPNVVLNIISTICNHLCEQGLFARVYISMFKVLHAITFTGLSLKAFAFSQHAILKACSPNTRMLSITLTDQEKW